ncbi:hypothetical protein E1J21_14375 [Xanthomonas hortorum pv. vitians]|nr:hypothetical protein [Xanthomonas hortorum pv. vitians]
MRLRLRLLHLTLTFLSHLPAAAFQRLSLRLIAIHEHTAHCRVGNLTLHRKKSIATLVGNHMVNALHTTDLSLEHDLPCRLLQFLPVGETTALA